MAKQVTTTTVIVPAPTADAELWHAYLIERRRALITELRRIEEMLGLPQSVELRSRPR